MPIDSPTHAHAATHEHGPTVPWTPDVQPQLFEELNAVVTIGDGERERIPVYAPFTGGCIGSVPSATNEDVRIAVERARAAQKRWARTPFAQRKAIMLRYHDMVLERQDQLLDVLQIEGGKARRHAFEEVLDVAINARYYAHRARKFLRPRRRKGALPLLTAAWEHYQPVGVVGFIAPWNYPFTLAVSDAIPAVMAGNAVILKPAQQTPFSGLIAVRLLREAGLPDDVFQVVTGRGSRIGPPLVEEVDFLGLTGSTETGRQVARQAGERLIQTTMELGGKNSMIVLDDADFQLTVEGAVRGCFTNVGQLCISFERLYVQDGIHDRFVPAFVERTKALHLAATFDYTEDMGALVSEQHLAEVKAYVDDAIARGATLLAGGRPRPDLGPCFYEPTILTDVTPEMKLHQEETFGPVVAIYRFTDEDSALEQADDTPFGLNASIWTRRSRHARKLAQRLHVGTVSINEGYAATWGSVDAPMGGMKASGISRRHGKAGLTKYTESQTIAVQRLHPIAPPYGVSSDQYARWMSRAIRLLRHLPGLR